MVLAFAAPARAEFRHGLSAFGDLKYAPDFEHFDYVKADASKGGRMAVIGPASRNTFDSLNGYIVKGDPAQGLQFTFDTLMTRAEDEPDAVYGLVAKDAELSGDKKSLTFRLRPEAKFSDGSPLTAGDVAFSFETLKTKGHPNYRSALRDVEKAEALDPATVRYIFTGDLVRDLPVTVATLPIFSKAYYATRDFEQTTLEPPVGSGPYKVGPFQSGQYIAYLRREDYWAKDLPVNRGRFNFGELRYDYYRNRDAGLEALFSAKLDFREEFTSVTWATRYGIPAVKENRLLLKTLPDDSSTAAQGFFINTRKDKFKDPRVRKALGLAFDFEWSNKNLFYGLYTRTQSFFENSNMKAVGPPSAAELALLEPYKDKLPPEVFGEAVLPPVSDGSGADRKLLREAQALLKEAGWLEPGGKVLEVEFLDDDPAFERILGPYVLNLNRIGVKASIRQVDPAQMERRLKSFDFDATTARYSLGLTPGVNLRTFWSSEAAKTDGSFNLAGIADPVVDALMDKIITATSREDLTTAARAADRVLRAGHYWVPQWYKASHNLAFWDKFGWPETKPKYDLGALDTWWHDPDKAAKLAAR